MISFRFHLVSLVAVFLAVALGVVVGSTVIDEAIVKGLEKRIDSVEDKGNLRKAENDALKSTVDQLDGYIEASAPFAVAGRLTGTPVPILAERGVDDGAVTATVELLRQAGAEAIGIIWLEPAWQLEGEDDVTRLAEAVGGSLDPEALRARGLARLAERVARASMPAVGTGQQNAGPGASTTTPEPDVLDALTEAGFVSMQTIGDVSDDAVARFPGPGARVLLVGGPTSEIAMPDVLASLARSFVDDNVPTVAAEVYAESDEGPDRGVALAAIRDDGALDDRVTTVDDLDLVPGRVSIVLGLEALADGTVGHYGYGSGAVRSLPEWIGS